MRAVKRGPAGKQEGRGRPVGREMRGKPRQPVASHAVMALNRITDAPRRHRGTRPSARLLVPPLPQQDDVNVTRPPKCHGRERDPWKCRGTHRPLGKHRRDPRASERRGMVNALPRNARLVRPGAVVYTSRGHRRGSLAGARSRKQQQNCRNRAKERARARRAGRPAGGPARGAQLRGGRAYLAGARHHRGAARDARARPELPKF